MNLRTLKRRRYRRRGRLVPWNLEPPGDCAGVWFCHSTITTEELRGPPMSWSPPEMLYQGEIVRLDADVLIRP
jgi:hypothetical protein